MDCLFCKIINKEIESNIIYEDDLFLVFLDAFPDAVGHMLIIPKKHIKDISEMDKETFSNMLEVINKMKVLLEKKLNIDGLTLIQNNGIAQEIMHFHLHLKPSYKKEINLSIKEVYSILKETN